MIESLGGIVGNGEYTTFWGERDKIKYDEVLRFCLKKENLDEMEPNKVYEGKKIGKYFITKGEVKNLI